MTYKTGRAHDSDVLRLDYERAGPDVGGLVGLCRDACIQVRGVSPINGRDWRACGSAAEQASEADLESGTRSILPKAWDGRSDKEAR